MGDGYWNAAAFTVQSCVGMRASGLHSNWSCHGEHVHFLGELCCCFASAVYRSMQGNASEFEMQCTHACTVTSRYH
jgi:hypothetical protein